MSGTTTNTDHFTIEYTHERFGVAVVSWSGGEVTTDGSAYSAAILAEAIALCGTPTLVRVHPGAQAVRATLAEPTGALGVLFHAGGRARKTLLASTRSIDDTVAQMLLPPTTDKLEKGV